jgi:hypothetical protein
LASRARQHALDVAGASHRLKCSTHADKSDAAVQIRTGPAAKPLASRARQQALETADASHRLKCSTQADKSAAAIHILTVVPRSPCRAARVSKRWTWPAPATG